MQGQNEKTKTYDLEKEASNAMINPTQRQKARREYSYLNYPNFGIVSSPTIISRMHTRITIHLKAKQMVDVYSWELIRMINHTIGSRVPRSSENEEIQLYIGPRRIHPKWIEWKVSAGTAWQNQIAELLHALDRI